MEYDDYKYEAAIGYLKKALELDPEYAAAYDTLGLCYEEMSDSPSALAHYEKATQFNRKKTPSSPWPPVNYAALLMKNNRIEEAEGLLKEALGYSSGMPQAHYQLGLVMEKQKKFPEALGALEKAAAHDAAFPDPHFAMMRISRQLGEKEKGEREMKIFQQLKQAQKMKEHPMMQSDLTMH
jgi:tetratricopeptide (TPR) repeat protein